MRYIYDIKFLIHQIQYSLNSLNFRRASHGNKKVVIGSGLFGLAITEKVAEVVKQEVTFIEKRSHIGDNAWSEFDEKTGIGTHKYGSHLFHKSYEGVRNYVNNFTKFNGYQHKVWTQHYGQTFPLPINLGTMSQFLSKSLSLHEAVGAFKDGRTLLSTARCITPS